jgi:hypothetical protein
MNHLGIKANAEYPYTQHIIQVRGMALKYHTFLNMLKQCFWTKYNWRNKNRDSKSLNPQQLLLWCIARQQLAKHIITGVSSTMQTWTAVMEPFKVVIYIRFFCHFIKRLYICQILVLNSWSVTKQRLNLESVIITCSYNLWVSSKFNHQI